MNKSLRKCRLVRLCARTITTSSKQEVQICKNLSTSSFTTKWQPRYFALWILFYTYFRLKLQVHVIMVCSVYTWNCLFICIYLRFGENNALHYPLNRHTIYGNVSFWQLTRWPRDGWTSHSLAMGHIGSMICWQWNVLAMRQLGNGTIRQRGISVLSH